MNAGSRQMGVNKLETALAETLPALGESAVLSTGPLVSTGVRVPALDQTCDMCADSTPESIVVNPELLAVLEPGMMMKHFRIEEQLGAGGMGQVYRARDVSLERVVALKVISGDLGEREEVIERFIREARAQARLNHPNVVSIYYIGRGHGRYFFAMELVRGQSLQHRLEQEGPLRWCDSVELMIQACQALKQATARGIIHRDIKPANLLVDPEGRLKIADFGLAWSASGPTGSKREGGFLGTPLYVAPEQARGEFVDHRADMYALGATFFHLIAGRPPFRGENFQELVNSHNLEAVPNIRQYSPQTPRVVRSILERLLSKRPEDRYADYDALLKALERARPRRVTPAGFWVRAVALFIDMIVAALLAAPLQWWLPNEGLVFLGVLGAYLWLALTWQGTTAGMWMLRLQTYNEDLAPPSWRRALVRVALQFWGPLGVALSWLAMVSTFGVSRLVVDTGRLLEGSMPLVEALFMLWESGLLLGYAVGLVMVAFHPRKQGLHDIWSRTRVLYRLAEDE